jgi:hypothetical protein
VALHHRRARTRAGHLLSLEASEENHQRASLARSLNYINEPKITQANTQQLFSAGAISHKQNPFEGASMMLDHRLARMPSGSFVRDRGITKRSQIRHADGQPFTTVRNLAGKQEPLWLLRSFAKRSGRPLAILAVGYQTNPNYLGNQRTFLDRLPQRGQTPVPLGRSSEKQPAQKRTHSLASRDERVSLYLCFSSLKHDVPTCTPEKRS